MGELSSSDASARREGYIARLEKVKKDVREDLTEMDFENALQRDRMERYVESIEEELTGLVRLLDGLTFE